MDSIRTWYAEDRGKRAVEALKKRGFKAFYVENQAQAKELTLKEIPPGAVVATQMIPSFPEELEMSITSVEDPLQTAYNIANFQRMDLKDAQEILEINSVSEKLKKLIGLLVREAEVLQLGQKIQNEARGEIEKVQRDYFLREQMKAIQKELGEKGEQAAEVEEFRKKIEEAKMPEEAAKLANRELDRLARLPTAAAEYGVIRTYLDWLVSLPWSIGTNDNLDIKHAREILDKDHYGLEDVKERILEFLAIRKRPGTAASP